MTFLVDPPESSACNRHGLGKRELYQLSRPSEDLVPLLQRERMDKELDSASNSISSTRLGTLRAGITHSTKREKTRDGGGRLLNFIGNVSSRAGYGLTGLSSRRQSW